MYSEKATKLCEIFTLLLTTVHTVKVKVSQNFVAFSEYTTLYQTKFLELFSGDSTDVGALHEDLIEVMPAVEEANSISEELDKRVKFEIILVAPNKLGTLKGIKYLCDKKSSF